jgi:hypothetical protein
MESHGARHLKNAEREYETSLLRLDMAEEECRVAAAGLLKLYGAETCHFFENHQGRAALKAHARAMWAQDREGFGQAVLNLARSRKLRPDRAVVRGIEIRYLRALVPSAVVDVMEEVRRREACAMKWKQSLPLINAALEERLAGRAVESAGSVKGSPLLDGDSERTKAAANKASLKKREREDVNATVTAPRRSSRLKKEERGKDEEEEKEFGGGNGCNNEDYVEHGSEEDDDEEDDEEEEEDSDKEKDGKKDEKTALALLPSTDPVVCAGRGKLELRFSVVSGSEAPYGDCEITWTDVCIPKTLLTNLKAEYMKMVQSRQLHPLLVRKGEGNILLREGMLRATGSGGNNLNESCLYGWDGRISHGSKTLTNFQGHLERVDFLISEYPALKSVCEFALNCFDLDRTILNSGRFHASICAQGATDLGIHTDGEEVEWFLVGRILLVNSGFDSEFVATSMRKGGRIIFQTGRDVTFWLISGADAGELPHGRLSRCTNECLKIQPCQFIFVMRYFKERVPVRSNPEYSATVSMWDTIYKDYAKFYWHGMKAKSYPKLLQDPVFQDRFAPFHPPAKLMTSFPVLPIKALEAVGITCVESKEGSMILLGAASGHILATLGLHRVVGGGHYGMRFAHINGSTIFSIAGEFNAVEKLDLIRDSMENVVTNDGKHARFWLKATKMLSSVAIASIEPFPMFVVGFLGVITLAGFATVTKREQGLSKQGKSILVFTCTFK